MTEPEFVCKLKDFIKNKYSNNANASKAWVVSPQFVGQVLRLKARPTAIMIADMGFEKTVTTTVIYRKIKS